MSNLSELLPAGAGAKSASFVASGTLGSGVTVALNSDGTVSVIEIGGPSAGSAENFNSSPSGSIATVFDSNSNKIVIAYSDGGNSSYGTAIVGTVSGTSISFGTPVTFNSTASLNMSMTFDSSNSKVVIAYRDNGNANYGTAIVGTVSGTSISFGTAVVFESANSVYISATFDSNSNKVVIAYQDAGNLDHGTAIVGTVSGTSISFGSARVFSPLSSFFTSATFDSNSNKVVIAWRDGNQGDGIAIVGTVSGTSINFLGPSEFFESGIVSEFISSTFDSNSNKIVISYALQNNSYYGTAIVGTVSGSSISFGSKVFFQSSSTDYGSATFDSNSNKVVISYKNVSNSGYGTVVVGTVSGTSISFGTPIIFEPSSTNGTASAFDSNSNTIVIAYPDAGNSNYGTSVLFQAESTNLTDFIGITDQAIADTATGAVIVQGGVSDKVSSLTTGSDYYVQADGSLSTTVSSAPAGRALSTTSILLEG